jgi:hypothetical protein
MATPGQEQGARMIESLGYTRQRTEASPNPHLSPTFPFLCLLSFYHLYILLASTINPPYLTLPTTNLNIYYLKTSFIY